MSLEQSQQQLHYFSHHQYRRDRIPPPSSPQDENLQSLRDIVGGPASTWLQESRHFDDPMNNNSSATNQGHHHQHHHATAGTSNLRLATYVTLLTLFMVWAGKHYLRHQRRRRHPTTEQVEEVIFVLGIPLLIPRPVPTPATTTAATADHNNDRRRNSATTANTIHTV